MSRTLARARLATWRRGPRASALALADHVQAVLEHRQHQRRGPRTFTLDGVEHTQLVHPYNRTWRNERAVEVPIALAFLDRHQGPVLELGNVLANYGRQGHVVVDRYEQTPEVLNEDIVDYQPAERFGAIVAVSTLEHVGWDEDPKDLGKIPRALLHLRHLLLPVGRLLVTCPLSYNPHLDALIASGSLEPDQQAFLVEEGGLWSQAEEAAARAQAKMGRYGGNALWVAELGP